MSEDRLSDNKRGIEQIKVRVEVVLNEKEGIRDRDLTFHRAIPVDSLVAERYEVGGDIPIIERVVVKGKGWDGGIVTTNEQMRDFITLRIKLSGEEAFAAVEVV